MFEEMHSTDNRKRPSRSIPIWAVFGSGSVLYTISFFLPAVAVTKGDTWPGWKCAAVTLQFWYPSGLLVGGMINILALINVALFAFDRAPRLRIVRAMFTAVNLALVAALLLRPRDRPVEIGFFVWTAGSLMITCTDLWKGIRRIFEDDEPLISAR